MEADGQVWIIAFFVAILCPLGVLSVYGQDEDDPVLDQCNLQQVVSGNNIYFIPELENPQRTDVGNGLCFSNVIVYARLPSVVNPPSASQQDSNSIESVQTSAWQEFVDPGTIKTDGDYVNDGPGSKRQKFNIDHIKGIDVIPNSWLDINGYYHSYVTLKAQVDFRRWLLERPNCANGCTLTAGRVSPFVISVPAVTGILDRDTFLIPLMKLEWYYDSSYRALLSDCQKQYSPNCSGPPWPDSFAYRVGKLSHARATLDAFSKVLAKASFGPQDYKSINEADCDPDDRSGVGGLKLACSAFDGYHDSDSEVAAPELLVKGAFYPDSLPTEEVQDAQARAAQAMAEAAALNDLEVWDPQISPGQNESQDPTAGNSQ